MNTALSQWRQTLRSHAEFAAWHAANGAVLGPQDAPFAIPLTWAADITGCGVPTTTGKVVLEGEGRVRAGNPVTLDPSTGQPLGGSSTYTRATSTPNAVKLAPNIRSRAAPRGIRHPAPPHGARRRAASSSSTIAIATPMAPSRSRRRARGDAKRAGKRPCATAESASPVRVERTPKKTSQRKTMRRAAWAPRGVRATALVAPTRWVIA